MKRLVCLCLISFIELLEEMTREEVEGGCVCPENLQHQYLTKIYNEQYKEYQGVCVCPNSLFCLAYRSCEIDHVCYLCLSYVWHRRITFQSNYSYKAICNRCPAKIKLLSMCVYVSLPVYISVCWWVSLLPRGSGFLSAWNFPQWEELNKNCEKFTYNTRRINVNLWYRWAKNCFANFISNMSWSNTINLY